MNPSQLVDVLKSIQRQGTETEGDAKRNTGFRVAALKVSDLKEGSQRVSGEEPATKVGEVQSLLSGRKGPLEKEMATHSIFLAWKIPWTEEPGRLPFMGLQRVRHDSDGAHMKPEYRPPLGKEEHANCWEEGHGRRDCPKRNNNQRRTGAQVMLTVGNKLTDSI